MFKVKSGKFFKFIVSVCIVYILMAKLFPAGECLAKCEKAWEDLQKATVELAAAEAAFRLLDEAYENAKWLLDRATEELKAVADKLGATGTVTTENVRLGKESSTGKAFYENPEYKNAKKKWDAAKAAFGKAKSNQFAAASSRLYMARNVFVNARVEYVMMRKQHGPKTGFDKKVEPPAAPKPIKVYDAVNVSNNLPVKTQLWYDTLKSEDVSSDIGCVLTKDGGATILEVSVLSTGKGSNFRKWTPGKPLLAIGSETIKPASISNFYVSKQSVVAGAAPLVFAAIGSQYVQDAPRAAASKGTACSGSSSGTSNTASRGAVASSIDRAGMAGGLGLLTSQAAGEIKGIKARFDVTGREKDLNNIRFTTVVSNEDLHENVNVAAPLNFFSDEGSAKTAIASDTTPPASASTPPDKQGEPTGPSADYLKKKGYVWDNKSKTWKKPLPPLYEEITDPATGNVIGIITPDKKIVKVGEKGYKEAEDGLLKQKEAEADKAWGEQVSRGQLADEEARNAKIAEIRRARAEALRKMQDADPSVQAQGKAEWEALK